MTQVLYSGGIANCFRSQRSLATGRFPVVGSVEGGVTRQLESLPDVRLFLSSFSGRPRIPSLHNYDSWLLPASGG